MLWLCCVGRIDVISITKRRRMVLRNKKKAALIAVVAVVVLTSLAAAGWAAPPGYVPWHNVLSGTSHAILGTVAAAKGGGKLDPAPEGSIASHVTLTGPITPAMRKANPNIPATEVVWHCDFYAYAGVGVNNDILWAVGQVLCNETMRITQTIYADRCDPLFWGCVWHTQSRMGPVCDTTNVGQWCPPQNAYNYVVQRGYKWRGRSYACVYPPGDIMHCISSSREVQF